jgi:hypothetical protein
MRIWHRYKLRPGQDDPAATAVIPAVFVAPQDQESRIPAERNLTAAVIFLQITAKAAWPSTKPPLFAGPTLLYSGYRRRPKNGTKFDRFAGTHDVIGRNGAAARLRQDRFGSFQIAVWAAEHQHRAPVILVSRGKWL